jgi:hypothetical protein
MHALLRTHHIHVPSRARLVRASAHRRAPLVIGRAGVSAAAGARTVPSGWAIRPPPAAPRARCCPPTCAPTVRPHRAAPAHPQRAPVGRVRQPCARGVRPRPTTGNDAAAQSNAAECGPSARRGSATRSARHRRKRARRRQRRRARDAQFLQELALAERLGERLHLRGGDGPAAHRYIYIYIDIDIYRYRYARYTHILCASTYVHQVLHMWRSRGHVCTATYTNIHTHMYLFVPVWCARCSPRVVASVGPCERDGAGTHNLFRLGQSTAAGSAASSVLYATLRANRAAAPGGSGPPRPRAGRPRAPDMRVADWSSAAADDRQRRRRRHRIQRRAARPQRPARQRHAQQRSAGTAANAQGGGAAGPDAQGLQELALAE